VRYKLVGGFRYYNREEVKDTLAYVRMALHPGTIFRCLRVLNGPGRGIGRKRRSDALRDAGRRRNRCSFWDCDWKSLMTKSGVEPVRFGCGWRLAGVSQLIQRHAGLVIREGDGGHLRYVLEGDRLSERAEGRNMPARRAWRG